MKRFGLMGSVAAMSPRGGLLGAMSPAERSRGRYMRDATGHTPTPTGTKSADQIADELMAKVNNATKAATDAAAEAVKAVDKLGDIPEGLKGTVDDLLQKMNGLTSQQTEFGQAIEALKKSGASDDQVATFGSQFVESDEFKSLIGEKQGRGRASLETKATITLATTNAAGSAGALIVPQRVPGILEIPQRRMTVRDLISPGQMGGNSLQYVRQTGFVNNADVVAEGARKPQSDLKLALVDTTAKVIAHFMKASRQVLDDAPQLRSLIDNNLLYGLAFKEEAELLYGDGTGQHLLGIVPQATPYNPPAAVGAALSPVDQLRMAILQAVLAEFPSTGIVLNPIDWARIEMMRVDKDAANKPKGAYLIGNPQGNTPMSLWRLPVVDTPAMTAGKFLTGAFRLGAQLFDRWVARVQLATENEDDFVNNLVTILAEERLALAVYRPEAFIYGTLDWTLYAPVA
jgi:HK97 family phage major capsid protein